MRKLPLNCGSSSSICRCTSSMSARVGRRGGGAASIAAVSVRSPRSPCPTRTRTSMLCFTSMANSTSTGEPTGSIGSRIGHDHLLDDAVLLEDRHDDAAGLVVRAAGELEHAGQRGPDGATTCLTRWRLRLSTSICSGLVMICVGSTPCPSGRPAPWQRTAMTDRAALASRRRRRRPAPGRCRSPAAVPHPGRTSRARPGTPRPSGPWPASGCGRTRRPERAPRQAGRAAHHAGQAGTIGITRMLAGLVTCSSSVSDVLVACSRPSPAETGTRAVRGRRAGRRRRRRTSPARAAAAPGCGRVPAGRGCRRRPAPSRAPAARGWSRRPARRNPRRDSRMPARSRAGPGRRGSSRSCDPPCP